MLYFRPPFDPAPFGPRVTQPYRGRIAALFDSRAARAPLERAEAEAEPDTESAAQTKSRSRAPR
ncbi:MAG: hypothetical protein IPF60_00045 [Betaproteobacteria bacterium]|nr:hypothetical protein [Betaproteobacteria bacterium]